MQKKLIRTLILCTVLVVSNSFEHDAKAGPIAEEIILTKRILSRHSPGQDGHGPASQDDICSNFVHNKNIQGCDKCKLAIVNLWNVFSSVWNHQGASPSILAKAREEVREQILEVYK